MERTILIVDDNLVNLRMAELILVNAGYVVKRATSGLQCLGILGEETVDLILLDIAMPIVDGFQTMKSIQEHDVWKKIPVFFLTADGARASVEEAVSLGAVDYIKKPFVPEQLLARVKHALDKY